jgi:hypothetical protein
MTETMKSRPARRTSGSGLVRVSFRSTAPAPVPIAASLRPFSRRHFSRSAASTPSADGGKSSIAS